jgi:hypothetical protein
MIATGYRWDFKTPYAKRVKCEAVEISLCVMADTIKGIEAQILKSRNGTRDKLIKIRDEMIDLYVSKINKVKAA